MHDHRPPPRPDADAPPEPPPPASAPGATSAEWTVGLRTALDKLFAEHRSRARALLAPFTVASSDCELPTVEQLAEHDREGAARAPRTGTPPRRPAAPLPPVEALAAIEDERVPAALAHLAAMQGVLTARLLGAVRNPPPPPAPPRPPSPRVEWLTVEEVVARLKKSAATVRRCIKRGEFPGAKKMGGAWRIPAAGVRAYETKSPEPPS